MLAHVCIFTVCLHILYTDMYMPAHCTDIPVHIHLHRHTLIHNTNVHIISYLNTAYVPLPISVFQRKSQLPWTETEDSEVIK